MNLRGYTSLTGPAGLWTKENMIGAKVKIRSVEIGPSLFAQDNEKIHEITEIKFVMDDEGKCITMACLSGETRPFQLCDLEFLSINEK